MNKTRKRTLKSRGKTRVRRGGAASVSEASAAKETESERIMREKEESRIRMKEMKDRSEKIWLEFKEKSEAKGEHPTREEYDKGTYTWRKPKESVANKSVANAANKSVANKVAYAGSYQNHWRPSSILATSYTKPDSKK